jgi:hypothetical protein
VFTESVISQSFQQLVILLESTNGLHCGLEQDPTEKKYSYCESDLPCRTRLWAPPNQGQCQRPHTEECNDDKGFPEIPLNLFLCKPWGLGGVQEFTAVFTLDCFVLNFFSAEGALFHHHLSWVEHDGQMRGGAVKELPEDFGEMSLSFFRVRCTYVCTPGMGVNLWGENRLYVNPVSDRYHWHKY